MAQRMREMRAGASDIGTIPEIFDPDRREACRFSLRLFCETYRPRAFSLGWSRDHLVAIERMQETILSGGLFSLAMPRGSGKTTLAVTAALWALLYGHRHWVCLIGATDAKAEKLLASIKTELRFNPHLLEDFPEVCWPVRCLQGRAARAGSQTYQGQATQIQWLTSQIVGPTISGSPSSGFVVSVCGVTGDVRGQQITTPDGEVLRPDYVIPDDPQTRESAKSPEQTRDRIAIVNGDILGLSGPGIKIAGVMPCTVIYRGDLADQALDPEVSPDWHGQRTQMLWGWPKNMDLWIQYREIQVASYRNGGQGAEATDFYVENQEAMDEGCEASWPERYNPDEFSAVQNAMNLYFRDEASFWAEYQNHPLETLQDESILSEDQITQKIADTPRRMLPELTYKLVAFIDVQNELLFYTVMAFAQDFSGTVVDYGAWPHQRGTTFRLQTTKNNLSKLYPGDPQEVKWTKALRDLVASLMATEWKTREGLEVSLSRILIDANYGKSRNTVYEFCRSSQYRSILMPSHGRGVKASNEPLNANHTRKLGRKVGTHWRIDRSKDTPIRHILYDTNYWKSFLHSRLATDAGSVGSVNLYQAQPYDHITIARHLKAELPKRVKAVNGGREVDEWAWKPDRPDNHWFDCLVGCCVAASYEGCRLPGEAGKKVVRSRAAVADLDGSNHPGEPHQDTQETQEPEQAQQPKPRKKRSVTYYD